LRAWPFVTYFLPETEKTVRKKKLLDPGLSPTTLDLGFSSKKSPSEESGPSL
jgi:hypothetical protein